MPKNCSWEVTNIISTVIDESHLTSETSIQNSHSWDSMAHVQILVELEKHFKLMLPIEEIAEVESVKDWIDLVEKQLEKRQSSE